MTETAIQGARRHYVLSSLDALRSVERQHDSGSPAWIIVRAAIDQCDGDVSTAVSRLLALQRRLRENRAVQDLLVPLLISTGRIEQAEDILGTLDIHDDAPRQALFGVVYSLRGRGEDARRLAQQAAERQADDNCDRLVVAQRLALSAYYRRDNVEAIERAREAQSLGRRLRAPRPVAAALSVEYAAVHAGSGDAGRAWHLAHAIADAARSGGDRSRRALGEVAVYELAVERADLDTAQSLNRMFLADPLPGQYRERFSRYFAEVCEGILSSQGYESAVAQLAALERTANDVGERAACKALRALCFAALDDISSARRDVRQSIAMTQRPSVTLDAGALRQRRLARAIAIAAGFLIGDVARGRRAMEAAFARDNPEVSAIVHAAERMCDTMPETVRGYVHIVRHAAAHRSVMFATGSLTRAERDILRLLSSGRSTTEISILRSCSVFTTQTHVRNAIAKLGARGRLDAVSRARALGLLSP